MDRTGFENLRVYNLSEKLADLVWDIVIKWDFLPQKTVGTQLIRSADSIGANMRKGPDVAVLVIIEDLLKSRGDLYLKLSIG